MFNIAIELLLRMLFIFFKLYLFFNNFLSNNALHSDLFFKLNFDNQLRNTWIHRERERDSIRERERGGVLKLSKINLYLIRDVTIKIKILNLKYSTNILFSSVQTIMKLIHFIINMNSVQAISRYNLSCVSCLTRSLMYLH